MYQYVSNCLYGLLILIYTIWYAVHNRPGRGTVVVCVQHGQASEESEEVRTRRVVAHVRCVLPYYGRLHALCPPSSRAYVLVDHACS